jgi:hypothetical protein
VAHGLLKTFGLVAATAFGVDAAAVCQTEDTTAAAAERRFTPGHYVAVSRDAGARTLGNAIKPGVTGLQKRYYWRTLEPEKGQYDFSAIEADLELVREHDLQLVVFVEDKTFNGEVATPDYLRDLTLKNRNRGYTAMRWDARVVDAMKELIAALGGAFDCEPHFEGIALQESALSLEDRDLEQHDYTPEKYRDALTELLLHAADNLPRSRVFWYMNFLSSGQKYLADIAEAVAPAGVVMGGPDLLPDRRSLRDAVYPLYDRFESRMPLFTSIQNDSFGHRRSNAAAGQKYWTMEDLFAYARDELHVDYIFWNLKSWKKPADSYDFSDALPVIERNPRFDR